MSEKYELTGTVKLIEDEQSFPSGFTKRGFVVTTADDKYPQDIKLEVVKDSCVKLDAFRPGDGIKVSFNVRGNEYNGKYYVQLAAWKLEKTGEGVGARSPEYVGREAPRNSGPGMPAAPAMDYFYENDQIPF